MDTKRRIEGYKADDGFTCEIWERRDIFGGHMYYAADKAGNTLLGGACCSDPEELKRVINLPR